MCLLREPSIKSSKNSYSWLRSRRLEAVVAAEGSYFVKIIRIQLNKYITFVNFFFIYLFYFLNFKESSDLIGTPCTISLDTYAHLV